MPRDCFPTCRRSTATSSSRSCWRTNGATPFRAGRTSPRARSPRSCRRTASPARGPSTRKDDRVFEVTPPTSTARSPASSTCATHRAPCKIDPNAHGSGFDRVSAFQDGYDNGLGQVQGLPRRRPDGARAAVQRRRGRGAAAATRPTTRSSTACPTTSRTTGPRSTPRLTDGQPWPPLHGIEPFVPTARRCAAASPPRATRCSIACQTITSAGTTSTRCREVYRQGGDYAVATLLATQYGLAALTRLGDESDEKTSTLRGDCLAGGYTASVILYNRPETSTYHISPGDLDEGIKALLVFRGDGDVERQGAGFERVRPSAKVSSTVRSPACSTRGRSWPADDTMSAMPDAAQSLPSLSDDRPGRPAGVGPTAGARVDGHRVDR